MLYAVCREDTLPEPLAIATLGGFSFVVGVLVLYALSLRAFGRRTGIDDILAGIRVARVVLSIGYVFVATVVILAFLAGFDVGLERSFGRLVVLVLLIFPVFFCVCYVIAMSQINLIVNIVILRYYEKRMVISDDTARLAVQRLLHRWSVLHRFLFRLRKTSLKEVEEVVCPPESQVDP